MSPPVINLQLHLPNQQVVYYWENQNLQNVLYWDHVSRTMLTEYFETCANESNARKYLYREFPEHYVWNRQNQIWTKRQNKTVIGRINSANPKEGERFYLRLLLNHVRGPTSFKDLLTIAGICYLSFKEATEKRGLLESDESITECLIEATTYQMPKALRKLFAIILYHCEPTNKDTMMGHLILYKWNIVWGTKQFVIMIYLLYILIRWKANDQIVQIIEEESIQIHPEDHDAETKLYPEQEKAFIIIMEGINSRRSGAFFIDGPGGTGKTFLYQALLAQVRSRHMIALATATSGVAAATLPGGRTAHSRFVLPLNPNETDFCGFSKQDGTAELKRRASLIIWDEAPMAKRFAIETVD
ncbi:uncharacterized protein LOC111281663 [Durio zibethinus]|uniref:ATP-dependent DNA helicase n=1 Tax=Durio zibethinus TaxID=66656 RepID=A0A6P5XB85_DURZI|nr:uncharacterized protein LOC111281663 [Durio zibethinus]